MKNLSSATVECVLDARAELAESPVWCPEEGALYWVDTPRGTLNRLEPGSGRNVEWRMPEPIGSCALRRGGGAVVALRSGFHAVDLDDGRITALARPADLPAGQRFNDGRCDRAGRMWAGTVGMPPDPSDPAARLYRLAPGAGCERVIDGLLISNGLAFSPDDRTLYLSDSHPSVQTIWAFDFDLDSGVVGRRRVFARTLDLAGRPDGAAVDSDGCYWSANVDGGQLVRFTPDGRVDGVVPMPVAKPTMCAFGDGDLRTLYVTSIRPSEEGRSPRHQPLAGGIFAVRVAVAGLPEPRFAG